MVDNNYSWNKVLKFSWSHIIALLTLIFFSYIVFMGDFYMNGSDFVMSGVKVLIIDGAILFTFIGAQIYKGSDSKFKKSLTIERILMLLAPIVFIISLIPYNHFLNVYSQKDRLKSQFSNTIVKSSRMFDEYNDYSNERLENYKLTLDEVIDQRESNRSLYTKAGFNGENDQIRRDNYISVLSLQLQSQNYDQLRGKALGWIEESDNGASVWNAFLIGNTHQITYALQSWRQTLVDYSTPTLSNEAILGKEIKAFDKDQLILRSLIAEFQMLSTIYTKRLGLNINTIWSSILIFILLLMPYILQSRNTKAQGLYSLFLTKKTEDDDILIEAKETSVEAKNDNPYSESF